jgi:putative NADPH-quinone reductase
MKTLVIYVHPVENSFNSAVRDAVISGLTSAQHEIRLRDLYAENFNPFLGAAERGLHHTPPSTRPELARDVEDLRWCEAIVFVYPTWWAGLPAMLKGWIDRTWMNEVAWVLPAPDKHHSSRGGHDARLVETRECFARRTRQTHYFAINSRDVQ